MHKQAGLEWGTALTHLQGGGELRVGHGLLPGFVIQVQRALQLLGEVSERVLRGLQVVHCLPPPQRNDRLVALSQGFHGELHRRHACKGGERCRTSLLRWPCGC